MHLGFQLAEEGQYGRIQRRTKMRGGYTTPNKNLKITYFVSTILNFYVISSSAETSNWNRLTTRTLEFLKKQKTDDFLNEIKKPRTLDIALYSKYCE
jgi:hypothetical protein